MRRALPNSQYSNGAAMYHQNTAPRYQQVVQQQQSVPQYQSVQYQPYAQRQYVAQPASPQAFAVARPLTQYQQQQYLSAPQAQQQVQRHYTNVPYPQQQQRYLEQLQQIRPNDLSAYHAAHDQHSSALSSAAVAQSQAEPQQQYVSMPYSQYLQQQQQQAQYAPSTAASQKEVQAALYAYQQQQAQQQQLREQQLLAQQQQEEMMSQQNILQDQRIQKQLLNQLYETFPPPASVTNEQKRDNYTVHQYYDFLQKQHEQILNNQQNELQTYGGHQGSASTKYSPSNEVSNVRFSGRNANYTFG